MSKRDPCLFLTDILEAVRRIEEYIEGYDFERFVNDRKTVDAVLRTSRSLEKLRETFQTR